MGTKVRILAAVTLDGVDYKPDQVVDLPAAIAKSLADQGQVDPHKDAVAYCVKELGVEVTVHIDKAAVRADLVAKAEALKVQLDAAKDEDKPAIQAEIDALAAEFAALG